MGQLFVHKKTRVFIIEFTNILRRDTKLLYN